jgi:hypothetical protein
MVVYVIHYKRLYNSQYVTLEKEKSRILYKLFQFSIKSLLEEVHRYEESQNLRNVCTSLPS